MLNSSSIARCSAPRRGNSTLLTGIALLLGLALVVPEAGAQQQPPPLQLNVPYHCPNNTTVVVKHCGKKNGTEFCSLVKGAPNGPLGDEISMPKAQAVALGLVCSVQGGGPASPAAPKPAAGASGKSFNPPYLSEMPSVERVMEALKTNDPRETALRQIWGFYELMEIIKTLSGPREFDRFLPDEQKFMVDYSAAQYKVIQASDKAFPGKDKPSEDLTFHFSRWDPRFGFKGINIWQFFSEDLQSQFAKIVGADNARYAAKRAEEKRTAAEALQANSQTAAPASGSPFIRNDPGTLAARRCVELGGSELECFGKAISTGLFDLAGVSSDAMKGPETSGVVMNGSYTNGSGMGLSFGPEKVALTGCGKLVPDSHFYTITKKPNQLLVDVKAEPTSFVLSTGNAGQLSGPASVDVKGQIITGYRRIWMQEYTNGVAKVGGSCPGGRCGYWDQVPVYAPEIERCKIGTFAPASPSQPEKTEPAALITSVLNSMAPPVGPTGLRMTGHYLSQGGLSLEFSEDSVVLDCGAAHVKLPYAVENSPNQILVTVKNGTTPFTLALQPNGTLTGSGTADVAGRVVTGSSGEALTYAGKNARCAIGTLAPKGKPTTAQISQ